MVGRREGPAAGRRDHPTARGDHRDRPLPAHRRRRAPPTSSGRWRTPSTRCSSDSRRRSTAQRALVDDVSHELRNPSRSSAPTSTPSSPTRTPTPDNRRRSGRRRLRCHRRHGPPPRGRPRRAAPALGGLRGARGRPRRDVAAQVVEEYRVARRRTRHPARRPGCRPGPLVYADEQALIRASATSCPTPSASPPPAESSPWRSAAAAGWAWSPSATRARGCRRRTRSASSTASTRPRSETPDEERDAATDGPRPSASGWRIARQIVEAHDGRLALFSTDGVGEHVRHLAPRPCVGGPRRQGRDPSRGPPRAQVSAAPIVGHAVR